MTGRRRHRKGDDSDTMRIHCVMLLEENGELFAELARFPKGIRRTARLKFLANEGLRHLRQQRPDSQADAVALPDLHRHLPSSAEGTSGLDDRALAETVGAAARQSDSLHAPANDQHEAPPIGLAAEIFGAPVDEFEFVRQPPHRHSR